MNLIYQNNTLLAASAQLVPYPASQSSVQWFSTGNSSQSSGQSVRVAVYSDQPGQLSIQVTDDPGLTDMAYEVARVEVSGKIAAHLEYGVTTQFWRFVYTNGPTAQSIMNILAYTSPDLKPALLNELRRQNLQLLAMRGKNDNSDDDLSLNLT